MTFLDLLIYLWIVLAINLIYLIDIEYLGYLLWVRLDSLYLSKSGLYYQIYVHKLWHFPLIIIVIFYLVYNEVPFFLTILVTSDFSHFFLDRFYNKFLNFNDFTRNKFSGIIEFLHWLSPFNFTDFCPHPNLYAFLLFILFYIF